MIPIAIDISETINEFSFSENESRALSRKIITTLHDTYKNYWEEEVKELKSSRDAYMRSMSSEIVDDYTAVFTLEGKGEDGTFAMMLETGADAFDMKEGFRKSDKAVNAGTDDWYLTIPFKTATASAIAESSTFASQMTDEVEVAVKKEGVLTSKNMPDFLKQKYVRPELEVKGVKIPKYESRSYMFEGLRQSGDAKNRGYVSFRRVSGNSEDNSWMHKGLEQRNFMDKSAERITQRLGSIIDKTVDDFLNQLL